jgi:hypothetical protein
MVFVTIIPAKYFMRNDSISLGLNSNLSINVIKNDSISTGKIGITSVNRCSLGTLIYTDSTITLTTDSGKTGTENVTYYVNNKRDSAQIIITVLGIKYTIAHDSLTLFENSNKKINVLKNDAISTGTLILSSVTNGKLGKATITDSSVHYTADSGKTGKDTVVYFVNDKKDSGKIFITITPTKYIITNDSTSVIQNSSRTINVIRNDTLNNGVLILSGVTDGKLGYATVSDSSVTYFADSGKIGADTLTYYVNAKKDSGKVFITILPILITTNKDSITLNEDSDSISIDVLANDNISTGTMVISSVTNAKLGSATIKQNQIHYRASLNKNGTDSLKYTVNNAKEELLIITIKAIKDKPVFTTILDTISINETQTNPWTFKATDVDTSSVLMQALKFNNEPWITIVNGQDSVNVTLSPPTSIASTINNPAIDSVLIRAIDQSNNDTIQKIVYIKVFNTNVKPAFANPIINDTITEGQTRAIQYSAADPDGDVPLISVVNPTSAPSWISFPSGESQNSITVTFNPNYDLSNAIDTAKGTFTLKVRDHKDSAFVTITTKVINKNRPPAFTVVPRLDSTEVGKVAAPFQFTATDPDARDVISFSFIEAVTGAAINSQNGTINWNVLKESFTPGNTIRIRVRASDGRAITDTSIYVKMAKHKWKEMNSNIPFTSNKFCAKDSNTLFGTNNFETYQELYTSTDGGNSFRVLNAQLTEPYQQAIHLEYINNNVILLNNYYLGFTGKYFIINPNNGVITADYNIGTPNKFALKKNDGSLLSYSNFSVGPVMGYTASEFFTLTSSIISKDLSISSIAIGSNYYWIQSENYLKITSTIETNSTSFGFNDVSSNYHPVLFSDNERADSIYAVDTAASYHRIYKYRANGTYSEFSIERFNINGKIKQLLMQSGSIGWLLTSTGHIYFTNDGFKTVSNDVITNLTVEYLFMSSDSKSVFAVARNPSNPSNWALFRY